jgi:hypothetical protein
MTPTPKLRFVDREVTTPHPIYIHVSEIKTVRILQQWWEHTEWNAPGEWRDVPLEVEA